MDLICSVRSCKGANIYYPYLQSSFDHPETNEKVHLILDSCYMLKLCRNTLGD